MIHEVPSALLVALGIMFATEICARPFELDADPDTSQMMPVACTSAVEPSAVALVRQRIT
jgi:hypothetical protein